VIVMPDVRPDVWPAELEEVLVRVGHRYGRVDLRRQMRPYVNGRLGPVGRKNSWQLAEHVGHRTPAGLQNLLNRARWIPDEVCDDLQEYVAQKLGEPGGVLIMDDTGFLTKGTVSVGVQRHPGTAGRTENRSHDPAGPGLVTAHRLGDRGLGPWPGMRLRGMLEEAGVDYVLAVPKSQPVPALGRTISSSPRRRTRHGKRHSCGDGAKEPRVYDWAAAKLPAVYDSDGDQPTHERWVLARRSLARPEEIAYYLAYALVGTEVPELARIAGSRRAIEECFRAAKNERGLDQLEVRRYPGWYRHITLAMLAHAFLAAMSATATTARESQKRFRCPCTSHCGRGPAAPGSSPSPTDTPAESRSRAELVLVAAPPPGNRTTLPLPSPPRWRLRTSGTRPPRQPNRLKKAPLTSRDSKLQLEY
jgi:SRSO17 transposase